MNRTAVALFCTLALTLLLTACASPDPAPCGSLDRDAGVVCGMQNPEDLRRLPDERTLLVSEISPMTAHSAGRLVFFDTVTRARLIAYPAPSSTAADAAPPWGSADCPGAPGTEFSPLGISVQQRQDGRWQVAAVNHGGRMSVEMFELLPEPAGYRLAWRGCVPMPEPLMLNSVALLRNGGFVASHMFDRTAATLFGVSVSAMKAELGLASGYAVEWLPAQPTQFRTLEGSAGPFPNGIALSADERTVYLALTSAHELRRLDRVSGQVTGSTHVQRPDNLVWDAQGRLLVASLLGSRMQNLHCIRHPGEPCGMAFEIIRVDPMSLRTEVVFAGEGSPMGAVTVAQQLGDWLYLGSFTGDRIMRIPYRP